MEEDVCQSKQILQVLWTLEIHPQKKKDHKSVVEVKGNAAGEKTQELRNSKCWQADSEHMFSEELFDPETDCACLDCNELFCSHSMEKLGFGGMNTSCEHTVSVLSWKISQSSSPVACGNEKGT
jgi:hypothetical protein